MIIKKPKQELKDKIYSLLHTEEDLNEIRFAK